MEGENGGERSSRLESMQFLPLLCELVGSCVESTLQNVLDILDGAVKHLHKPAPPPHPPAPGSLTARLEGTVSAEPTMAGELTARPPLVVDGQIDAQRRH